MNNNKGCLAARVCVCLLGLSSAMGAVAEQFSIVVIPDTQWYAENNPAIIDAQFQWVVDNRVAENIIYVAHLGDLKDDRNCAVNSIGGRTEWEVVNDAVRRLEDPNADGIPYGIPPGNHDFDPLNGNCPIDNLNRTLNEFDRLFGPGRFTGRSYYGGAYPAGSHENSYMLIGACGYEFIVLNLGFFQNAPRSDIADALFNWANGILSDPVHAHRIGIVVSHNLLRADTSTTGAAYSGFGTAVSSNIVQNPANPNLWLMLSGHARGESWLTDTRDPPLRAVEVLMANYQDVFYPESNNPNFAQLNTADPNIGGNSGFMRIMRFDTDTGLVEVETFAPAVPGMPGRSEDLISDNTVTNGDAMDSATASRFTLPMPPSNAVCARPQPPQMLELNP